MIFLLLLLSSTPDLEKAPAFTAEKMNGEEFVLDSLKGEGLVILDFWAVLCKPCVRQLEAVNEMIDEFEDTLHYLAINEDNPMFQSRAKNFVKAKKFKFTVLFDKDGEIGRDYSVSDFPTTFFLDDSLNILEIHQGFNVGDEQWLKETIEEYLEKMKE